MSFRREAAGAAHGKTLKVGDCPCVLPISPHCRPLPLVPGALEQLIRLSMGEDWHALSAGLAAALRAHAVQVWEREGSPRPVCPRLQQIDLHEQCGQAVRDELRRLMAEGVLPPAPISDYQQGCTWVD